MAVVPYKEKEATKKEQVAEMFNNISHKYDFLNHFLSAGIDIWWRKTALKRLKKLLRNKKVDSLLDVATGTGDFALEAHKILKPEKIIGVDISEGMLSYFSPKIKKRNLEKIITFEVGDSENLRFEDNTFDVVIVAFGVRNFENLQKGIEGIFRVLKPNGYLLVLEFSKPTIFPIKQMYQFYFKNVLPNIGRWISKDSAAYTYLPESVEAFPDGYDFADILLEANFKNVECIPLTLGVCSAYYAQK
jgi:demethylmenaquinone methyltransferase/2-methoxy-6-polyprenyl-1,4-benzoquinol methylase